MVGFIGISSPFSILAQEYYDDQYETEYYNDDYEKEYNSYEKYMKDDNSKPSIQKISCNNIIKNLPVDNNVDTSNALDSTNGDSQSGQDRMNNNGYSDQEGNFVFVCQNNNIENNNFNIVNNISVSQVNDCGNGELPLNINCTNTASVPNGTNGSVSQVNDCGNGELPENVECTNTASLDPNTNDVITTSSITDDNQSLVHSQQIKQLSKYNAPENKQQNLSKDIRESLLSLLSQSSKTSPPTITHETGDLSTLEKVEKLKAQYVELYQ
jgi:hypothetical protein